MRMGNACGGTPQTRSWVGWPILSMGGWPTQRASAKLNRQTTLREEHNNSLDTFVCPVILLYNIVCHRDKLLGIKDRGLKFFDITTLRYIPRPNLLIPKDQGR